ncbi:hypothetical protein HMPREF9579_01332 [Cutibacterium acnes HL087PA1]|nr:hypothetical protein HMPREF9579_01332 [Cutibacterium acnes HL087PA1]
MHSPTSFRPGPLQRELPGHRDALGEVNLGFLVHGHQRHSDRRTDVLPDRGHVFSVSAQ